MSDGCISTSGYHLHGMDSGCRAKGIKARAEKGIKAFNILSMR
jgi:transglutaminase-like putative cysteine protease